MNAGTHDEGRHVHVYQDVNGRAERNTRIVVWITAAMMVVEIGAGLWFNSMAVLADGLHMGSHALAIGLSAVAYALARRYANDVRFAFGTWKIEVLGGFASAIMLVAVAAAMVAGSIERLVAPAPIRYTEALVVAVVGLLVNLVCAIILARAHDHGHIHGHDAGHSHGHAEDLNLKSAYVHVITDAATSVLAIAALLCGSLLGWGWMDPAMGILGAILVGIWAKGLIADTSKVLLDREMDAPVVEEIREAVAALNGGTAAIRDLHVWRVGTNAYCCAISLDTVDQALTTADVRRALSVHEEIVHTTIEINRR